jgi:hypothetical protein
MAKNLGVECPAIDGLLDEAEEVAGEVEDKSVLDAALIAAAQAVEHYEITRYGTLVAWAKELGRNDCAALLQQNVDEEKATDKKLTAMAESRVIAAPRRPPTWRWAAWQPRRLPAASLEAVPVRLAILSVYRRLAMATRTRKRTSSSGGSGTHVKFHSAEGGAPRCQFRAPP